MQERPQDGTPPAQTAPAAPCLELDGLAKSFGRGRRQVRVLENVSLTVGQGEFVSLIGPSGSGKSTILHLIGGLLPPDAGAIRMEGREVTGRKGLISYMPQSAALFPWRTIEDNAVLAREVAGLPRAESLALAREWLAKVGLAGYERAYPHMLSGGMQQRAAFVRALLSPQEFLCLDEPFGALDALTRQDMQQWLLALWEANRRSVLFITHSIEEALLLSDRVYLLSGKPTRVLRELRVPFGRPRAEDVADDPRFLELKREIYEEMKREQARQETAAREAAPPAGRFGFRR
ncbi:ABC transporter ATP-binding protein [Paenibacillus sp. J31TS4]|uniref:ABC transporter ATP-binding protein n=1 Tax=Paenibacillus sp. J31TS4 TaxID=2807195 RepID=UPI0020BE5E73|nr:ABC transporter ATP-binding protein [Paenibacillus sp. J31TS4]